MSLSAVVRLEVGSRAKDATLLFLQDTNEDVSGGSALRYLQRARMTSDATTLHQIAEAYARRLPEVVARFKDMISGRHVDLLVRAPSTRDDAQPFLEIARAAYPDAADLTDRMWRMDPDVRSGKGISLEVLTRNLKFDDRKAPLANARSLLIIDDTFDTGHTASSLCTVLHEHGMPLDTEVVIAVVLRIVPPPVDGSAIAAILREMRDEMDCE